jgi:hypothetical protein
MLEKFDKTQQVKVINTINKMLFDINTIYTKDDDEPFEIGVRLKTGQEQDYIFFVFSKIFENHDRITVMQKKDDDDRLIVCVIRE